MNCDKKDLLLYAVTDRSWLNGQTLCEQVEQALKGGVTFLQLREKELDDQEFLEEAQVIQQLCRKYQVPFLINDNVALAAKIGADGVHVGQSDMAAGEARAKLGTDRIIGVSARTVGAVFHTGSKADAAEVDHQVLRDICRAVDIPVIAIGGITRDNVAQLKHSGICGIAVMSAIFAQKNIEAAASELRMLTEEMVKE